VSDVDPGAQVAAEPAAVAPPETIGLARERTALAWSRTGLSFVAAGAVLLRLLDQADAGAMPLWLAVAIVALGSVAWCWAWRSAAVSPAVDSAIGRAVMRSLAWGLAAVALGAAALQR
jgi:uncharacterized membrane protein YidH (DUF202 family)